MEFEWNLNFAVSISCVVHSREKKRNFLNPHELWMLRGVNGHWLAWRVRMRSISIGLRCGVGGNMSMVGGGFGLDMRRMWKCLI